MDFYTRREVPESSSRGDEGISAREMYCPNFKIPSLENPFDEYNSTGPRAGVDYSVYNGRAITIICDHSKCQPFAEYEFAMIELFTKKKITAAQWIANRPQMRTFDTSFPRTPKDWCFGQSLDKYTLGRGVMNSPLARNFDMVPCNHVFGHCVGASAAAVALHALTNTGQVSMDVLDQILKNGWSATCERAVGFGLNPMCTLFEKSKRDFTHLWRPYMLEEWYDMTEKEHDRLLAIARNEENHEKVNEMLEHARLKCYYRQSGTKRVVILKRKFDALAVEMRHTPQIVSKLARLWVATGQDVKDLIQGIEKTAQDYKAMKESRV